MNSRHRIGSPGRRYLAAALLALGGCSTPSALPETADLLVRGGTVYPGGTAPFTGDVAIRDDRIVAIGPDLAIPARRTIDAAGMIVAPGFIDPHTHAQPWLTSPDAQTRLVKVFLLQGVTTAFVGNDGGGPIAVGALLESASVRPVGVNYAVYTGFGTIRSQVIGAARRAPDPAELEAERHLVRRAMCEGAIGLSTGLFYAPQSFSRTDEVAALAREAARYGGVYDTHLRDEASYTIGLQAAVEEAIAIGREAGIRVHIAHIKALGVDQHGASRQITATIAAARKEGLAITADQYPWSASGTSLVAALVPLWAQDGGRQAMLERFDNPALLARLETEIAENLRRRGGPQSLLITQGRFSGQRLDAVSRELRLPPVRAAMAVVREADAATISFNMAEPDIVHFMQQPWVVTGSDASSAHPRVYGSFARKYARYVRQEQALSVQEFIDRSSATTADIFGLDRRGHLRVGNFADVVVIDPVNYAARATYEQPEIPAAGVRTVIVNGVVAVDNGALTGAAAGRALPRRVSDTSCP